MSECQHKIPALISADEWDALYWEEEDLDGELEMSICLGLPDAAKLRAELMRVRRRITQVRLTGLLAQDVGPDNVCPYLFDEQMI